MQQGFILMDEKSPDKLGLKGRMQIFAALQHTYDRETAFDVATKSNDYMLKLVAIASADQSGGREDACPSPRCVVAVRISPPGYGMGAHPEGNGELAQNGRIALAQVCCIEEGTGNLIPHRLVFSIGRQLQRIDAEFFAGIF